MVDTRKRELMPFDLWKIAEQEAQAEADRCVPLPKHSEAVMTLGWFFGASTITFFVLGALDLFGLVRATNDESDYSGPALLLGAVCGLVAYLHSRWRRKAHFAISASIHAKHEERWLAGRSRQ